MALLGQKNSDSSVQMSANIKVYETLISLWLFSIKWKHLFSSNR